MRYETAESVTIGHPDKCADYIADRILDECMKQDPQSRVAVEVMLSHEVMMVAGEITTKAKVDYQEVAEAALKEIGYEPPGSYVCDIKEQSPEIKQAVDGTDEEQGAGDQGIVYGYCTDETFSGLPLEIDLARRITSYLQVMNGRYPDGKAQVTIARNDDGYYDHIAAIVVSTQHSPHSGIDSVRQAVLEKVIKPALAGFDLSYTKILVNSGGAWTVGGFAADTGLTGRKLMADTYGGIVRHGGGAMHGKDPSKVDRSGALMARYIANAVVQARLAYKCEVQIAYAIGQANPVAVSINTFGTARHYSEKYIAEAVRRAFNLTPAGIIKELNLKSITYAPTARVGVFGQEARTMGYQWEIIPKLTIKKLKDTVREVANETKSVRVIRRYRRSGEST